MNSTQYLNQLNYIMMQMEFTDNYNQKMDREKILEQCIQLFRKCRTGSGRIFVVGNGGSAAIASHTAIDYLKNGGMATVCFNDGALLTCYSNDYGYENVFSKPIEGLATCNDILIAISSSGKSPNILNAAMEMSKKGGHVVTLSGFEPENPLRKKGDYNIYVPSFEYGMVELVHQIFLHMTLDLLMEKVNGELQETLSFR
jgi:D-sedoheptulose 7-phosphate isomerase